MTVERPTRFERDFFGDASEAVEAPKAVGVAPKAPRRGRAKKIVEVAPEPPPPPPEDTRSPLEKYAAGEYTSKLTFVGKDKDARRAYNEDQSRLYAQFKQDLFAYHGVSQHPNREIAYAIAYDARHSSGMGEVAQFFEELTQLLT